jgi:hypothetical protein
VTVGDTEVLVQVAAALLLVVQLVRRGGWGLLVLQGLLMVVEGERKMWVDHNTSSTTNPTSHKLNLSLRRLAMQRASRFCFYQSFIVN